MPFFARDVGGVFIGVNLHHLGMALDQSGKGGVDVQFAESLPERLVLLGRHFLVAEEQHGVFGQGVVQRVEGLVAQWLREIDPADFGAAVGRRSGNRD